MEASLGASVRESRELKGGEKQVKSCIERLLSEIILCYKDCKGVTECKLCCIFLNCSYKRVIWETKISE